MSGAVVFAGTHVPVQTLMDYLEEGDSLEELLEDFPTVSREHAIHVLELAKEAMDDLVNDRRVSDPRTTEMAPIHLLW